MMMREASLMSEVLGFVAIDPSLGEGNGDAGFFVGEAKALPSLCILDFIFGGSLNFLKGVKGMPEFFTLESEALVDAAASKPSRCQPHHGGTSPLLQSKP